MRISTNNKPTTDKQNINKSLKLDILNWNYTINHFK